MREDIFVESSKTNVWEGSLYSIAAIHASHANRCCFGNFWQWSRIYAPNLGNPLCVAFTLNGYFTCALLVSSNKGNTIPEPIIWP
jgi:hypothetical protein